MRYQRKQVPKDIVDMAKSLAKLVHEMDMKKGKTKMDIREIAGRKTL